MSIISFNFTLSAIEILYKVLIVKLTLPVSIRDICVCIYLLLCGYPACSVEIFNGDAEVFTQNRQ